MIFSISQPTASIVASFLLCSRARPAARDPNGRGGQAQPTVPVRALDTEAPSDHVPRPRDGAVAQLGERVVRNDEVRGSIPLSSTIRSLCFSMYQWVALQPLS